MAQNIEATEVLAQRLTPAVKKVIDEGSEDRKIEVILEFDEYQVYRRSRIRRAIRRLGGRVLRELPLINALAVELPASGLREFVPKYQPRMVWSDQKVKSCLNVAVPSIHADLAHKAGLTGQRVTVAVIDTGIDPHPDLTTPKNRIIGWKDMVNDKHRPYDDNGHGTHVAGIIAGNGGQSGGKYQGVAPDAKLVGVKVLDDEGSGNISQVVAAVDWVIRNKRRYNIRVLNLSLGAHAEKGYQEDPISRIAEEAWKRGIVVCAAAGNEGPKYETINTPGINPSIITVGNINDRDTIPRPDDKLADTSSRGPTIDELLKPDILAPGTNIVSLKPGGGYISYSGTSMATPMVSGASAILLQQNPRLTPLEVKEILLSGAEDRGYSLDEQGKGYLDLTDPLKIKEKIVPVKAAVIDPVSVRQRVMQGLLQILHNFFSKGKKPNLKEMLPILIMALNPAGDFSVTEQPNPLVSFLSNPDLINKVKPLLSIFGGAKGSDMLTFLLNTLSSGGQSGNTAKLVGSNLNPITGLIQTMSTWLRGSGLPI
jgi:serine protease AprX